VGADIDQKHPDVTSDLFNWGTWVLSILGDSAAGFRFDAIKHIDEGFIAAFVKHVRQKTGQTNLFAVGEFWSDSIEDIFRYLDGFGTQVRWMRNSELLWHFLNYPYTVQHFRRAFALQLQGGRRCWQELRH